jgi:predicted esterase
MIAIALQTVISLTLSFAVGFVTAWIMRGGREQRGFEEFFATWRSRYDQLEQDRDDRLAQVSRLQKDLDAATERYSISRIRPERETETTETSPDR